MKARLSAEGIRPHTAPASYRGVALMVVRNEEDKPLVAFDANGTVYFLTHDAYLEARDISVPVTEDAILEAVEP